MGDNVSSFRIPKTIRHLFVKTKNLEVLRMIKDVKSLHSLFVTSEIHGQYFTEILTKNFEASRRIRLLFICSPYQEKMFEAIKNLRHLRYLNFNGSLTQMLRSLSCLYHLQLIIYNNSAGGTCSDDFLPSDVSNLSNLHHLELPPNVVSRVPGIGKLRSLQELNEFNVKNENGYRIEELEHMSELRKLKINFLENVKDATEACNAKLCEKRKLTDLSLNWGNTVDELNSDVSVLENLKPHKNLKRLSIVAYKGVSCAEWMYNADLISNLEHINLNGCSEWETLPPFGQLPHLKSLYLCNMPKVKQLDNKFSGNINICVFPALDDLFDKAGAAADYCFFPCLTELFLVNCPNLQELPYLPRKLKKMKIQNIGWKAAFNWKQGSNNCCGKSKSIPLESLEVLSCPNITSILLADVRHEALRKLRIEGCPNLISLGGLQQVENGIEKFQPILTEVVIDEPSLLPMVSIASLEKLTICNNDVLQSLPSSLERLSSLKILHVEKVPRLQQILHIPATLEELYLEYLESLQCLPVSLSTISFLNRLWLNSIPLLKSLPSSLSAISSLKHIVLDNTPSLKSLPDLPSSLHYLTLFRLDNLECLPSSLSSISSLVLLDLDSIPLLKSLPDLPSSLYSLSLCSLKNLQCMPSSLSAISSLELLHLNSIPLLKSLPELPSSLDYLFISRLDNLQCLPSSLSAISSLSHLVLGGIPLLKSLPDLPSSLVSITVENCHPELMKRSKKFSCFYSHMIARALVL